MRAIDLPESQALLAALPPVAALLRDPQVAAEWAAPSDLPGYHVGGVGGHLVRAVGRLESTLAGPTPVGDDAKLTDWYLDNRVAGPEDLDADFPRFLREDGEQLGRQGPEALAAEVDALSGRLADQLAAEAADRRVATGARLDPPTFDQTVFDAVTAFLMRLARVRSGDVAVVRALTRSGRVADPYDVLRVV